MFTSLSLISVLLFHFLKRSTYVLVVGMSFVIFSVSIDALYLGYFKEMMVYDTVRIDDTLFYIWVSNYLAFIIFCLIIKKDPGHRTTVLNRKKLAWLGYAFFTVALSATAFNTYNALTTISVVDILINVRAWELSFGRSAIFNYLYFLHIISATIFAVLYKYHKRKLYLFIICVSILMSLFHGIKFTILHAVMFPSLAYFILNEYKVNRVIIVTAAAIFLIFLGYFQFVRGGGLQGVGGYIFTPPVQAVYTIQNQSVLTNEPAGVFYPDLGNIRSHVTTRLGIGGQSQQSSSGLNTITEDEEAIMKAKGFLLNNKYNVTAPIVYVSLFTSLSYFIPFIFLAFMINFVRSRDYNTFFYIFTESYIFMNSILLFWGWKFFDLKMLFLLTVITLLSVKLKK